MISLADGVGYIHEPFNQGHGQCICGYNIECWYQGVRPETELIFRRHFDHLLRFSGHTLLSDVKNAKFKKIGVQLRRGQLDVVSAIGNHRPLIKDPLALLSADWLYESYGAQVIITVRHPAAFVDSLRRKNWTFDFRNLTNQPELLQGKLAPFSEELMAAAELNQKIEQGSEGADAGAVFPIEKQAMLIWKVLHSVILDYQRKFPDWIVLRHEDISITPFEHFKNIYEQLGLPFTLKVKSQLDSFVNPKTETAGKRRSADNVRRWKSRLPPQLIEEIRTFTSEISDHFYSDNDW